MTIDITRRCFIKIASSAVALPIFAAPANRASRAGQAISHRLRATAWIHGGYFRAEHCRLSKRKARTDSVRREQDRSQRANRCDRGQARTRRWPHPIDEHGLATNHAE